MWGSSNCICPESSLLSQFLCQLKIDKIQIPRFINDDILGFEVPEDYIVVV